MVVDLWGDGQVFVAADRVAAIVVNERAGEVVAFIPGVPGGGLTVQPAEKGAARLQSLARAAVDRVNAARAR